MKNKIAITTLCLGLIFTCGTLSAQEKRLDRKHKPTVEEIFSKLDADNSGLLDKKEVEQGKRSKLSEHFEKIDLNGDGLLSPEELQERRERRKPPRKG